MGLTRTTADTTRSDNMFDAKQKQIEVIEVVAEVVPWNWKGWWDGDGDEARNKSSERAPRTPTSRRREGSPPISRTVPPSTPFASLLPVFFFVFSETGTCNGGYKLPVRLKSFGMQIFSSFLIKLFRFYFLNIVVIFSFFFL